MASVAHIQALRAALALGTFTARELADETAIPLESVRTLLKRQTRHFTDAGISEDVVSARRSGRPARRYTLRDPDAARREVEAIEPLPAAALVEPRSAAERDGSVLDLALANLRAALTEAPNDDRATATRIETAQRTAGVVLHGKDTAPETRARAHEYIAVGHITRGLLLCDGENRMDALAAAAEQGFAALKLDPEAGRRVTRLLLAAADKSGIDPPVAETITFNPSVGHGLFRGEVEDVELVGRLFRVPTYASALMRGGSPAGVVIRVVEQDTEQSVEDTLERLDELKLPTYVALETPRDDRFTAAVQGMAVQTAAYWIPVGATLAGGVLTGAIASALDKVVSFKEDRVVLDAIEALPG